MAFVFAFSGTGGFHLFWPEVSSAYGIPSHFLRSTDVVVISRNPLTGPDVVFTKSKGTSHVTPCTSVNNAIETRSIWSNFQGIMRVESSWENQGQGDCR